MKVRVPWFARLLVSAGLLALLCYFIPLSQLGEAVRGVSVALALACFVGFLVGHFVAAFKWWWLLSSHATVPFRLALRAHFAGLMANLCLPGIAGGDVVRAAWVMRHVKTYAGIGVASVTDRLLDCSALLLLAGLGVALTSHVGGVVGQAFLLGGGVILALAGAGGVAFIVLRHWPSGSKLASVAEAMNVMARHPWVLLRTLLLSLAVQGSFVGLNMWLGLAAGVEVTLGAWLVAWPLAKLLALVPLSLGGLGVREAALVFLMRPFGASSAAVTVAGLLWQAVLASGGIVGGLVVMLSQTPAAVAQGEPVLS